MIRASFQAICQTCGAAGPAADSRALSWDAARELGWTLRRERAWHFCPRCSGAEETRADDERATVEEVVAGGTWLGPGQFVVHQTQPAGVQFPRAGAVEYPPTVWSAPR